MGALNSDSVFVANQNFQKATECILSICVGPRMNREGCIWVFKAKILWLGDFEWRNGNDIIPQTIVEEYNYVTQHNLTQ